MPATLKNYIVYQAYGNKSILNECLFSLLTLSRCQSQDLFTNTEIWIYTDTEQHFQSTNDCPLSLNFRCVDKEQIKKWRGEIDFVHRVKIEILKDLVNNNSGNILYLDTDTVFLQPIENVINTIGDGQLYMHLNEGVVADGKNKVLAKLNSFLQTKKLIDIPTKATMWNAGVLGFNTEYKGILDEVLALTDKLHAQYPKHIVEQFAFSLLFQKQKQIKAAYPYILHYWNLKELRIVLDSFFDNFKGATWSDLEWYSRLIEPSVYMQQKAGFYKNRSITEKIAKKTWQPEVPNWSALLQQL